MLYESQVNPAPRFPNEENPFCKAGFVDAEALFLP